MQLKRSEAPRSGTRNGLREKEHTSTVNMEALTVEYACRELTEQVKPTPESEKNMDRVTVPRYPDRNNTDNRELQIEDSQENAQDYGVRLAKIVCTTRTSSTPAQQPRRSSPAAPAAVPPGDTD